MGLLASTLVKAVKFSTLYQNKNSKVVKYKDGDETITI